MTREQYLETVFKMLPKENPPKKEELISDSRVGEALKHAHRIREFEISLYWKRSLFFWGFLVTLFAAFGLLISADKQTISIKFMIFGVSLLGLFVNFAWYYLAKGSKAWQKNWEQHIDYLEYDFSGNLHKIAMGKEENFFSVSRITETVIIAFVLFWVLASVVGAASFARLIQAKRCCFSPQMSEYFALLITVLPLIIVIIFILYLFFTMPPDRWKTTPETLGEKAKLQDGTVLDDCWERILPTGNSDD
jgi:hypothetical protein